MAYLRSGIDGGRQGSSLVRNRVMDIRGDLATGGRLDGCSCWNRQGNSGRHGDLFQGLTPARGRQVSRQKLRTHDGGKNTGVPVFLFSIFVRAGGSSAVALFIDASSKIIVVAQVTCAKKPLPEARR